MKPLSETPLESCRTIADFISRHAGDDSSTADIRAALLTDLCWRARALHDQSKAVVLAQGMYYTLPVSIRRLLSEEELGIRALHELPAWTRDRRDVAIITIVKPELDAVLQTVGIESDKPASVGGFDFWLGRVLRGHRPPLSVVVTRLGKPRNVPMAMRVQSLLTYFDVGLLVVVGVAAGFEDKLSLGDVAIADRVFDYEHVRSELHGHEVVEKPRPLILEIPGRVARDLDLFEPQSLKNVFAETSRKIDTGRAPAAVGWRQPKYERGTIAAGERLLADGSLRGMRDRLDNRIIAGDQEDSGFAQAAELADIPWCVFRGVSDFGDPNKPPGDDWHFAASLGAASAAVAFLRYAYRPASDSDF